MKWVFAVFLEWNCSCCWVGRLLLKLVLFILLFILELLLLAKVGACCWVSGVVGAFLSGVGVFWSWFLELEFSLLLERVFVVLLLFLEERVHYCWVFVLKLNPFLRGFWSQICFEGVFLSQKVNRCRSWRRWICFWCCCWSWIFFLALAGVEL